MELALVLNKDSELSLQRQIYEGVSTLIASGALPQDSTLPSTRALSQVLAVSRITVIEAYRMLNAQGHTRVLNGKTVVRAQKTVGLIQAAHSQESSYFEPPPPVVLEEIEPSNFGKKINRLDHLSSTSVDLPGLNYGAIDTDLLPIKVWEKLTRKSCNTVNWGTALQELETFGYRPLRAAIAKYFGRTRGVCCSTDQVIIFSSAQQGLDLVARLMVEAGDLIAVENPGFVAARQTFAAAGAQLVPVAVDSDGMRVPDLIESQSKIKLAFVSSLHQDPSGVILSTERRKMLINWAKQNKILIIEDDFDYQFRYVREPAPSLQSMNSAQVIYMSTFWKALFPLSALGILIVPQSLIALFERGKEHCDRGASLIESIALTQFISDGHLEMHIARTRSICAQRRSALMLALASTFKNKIVVAKHSGGTHLKVQFDRAISEHVILSSAAKAGIEIVSTYSFYVDNPRRNEFLLSFAHPSLANPIATQEIVRHWGELLEAACLFGAAAKDQSGGGTVESALTGFYQLPSATASTA